VEDSDPPLYLVRNSAHHVKNSIQFIQILKPLQVKPDNLMVSYNMVSPFTKVPIAVSLKLLSHLFEDDVLALLKHVLTSTYFCFEGQFYKQTE